MKNGTVLAALMILTGPATAQALVYSVQASAPRATVPVFDPVRGVVVTVEGGASGRMWEWNGTRWSERIDVATTLIADGQAAAYDARRGRLVWVVSNNSSLWIQEWDGAQWQVITSPTAPPAGIAGAAFDPVRGRFVVLQAGQPSLLVTEWDGSRWWSITPASSPAARSAIAVAWDPNRRAVVFHGGLGAAGPLAGTWSWDGTAFTLISSGGPPPRSAASFCFDPRGNRLLLYGGLAGSTLLNDTWALDLQGWTQLLPAHDPGPRFAAQLVDDGTGLLLFGGRVSSFTSLIDPDEPFWRWDGVDWQRLTVDGEPNAQRTDHGMVWDEAHGEALLFGGTYYPPATIYADTWTWDGSWHRRHPAHGPALLSRMGMACDPQRGTVVMFGGGGGSSLTWTWDGSDWTLRQPANWPAPRFWLAMAYDRARNVVLLHGGTDGTTTFGDLWQWNGSDWSQIVATGGPGPRFQHAMAYDEVRSRTVLFGNQGTPSANDTWEWDGANWISTNPTTLPVSFLGQMVFDHAVGQVALRSTQLYHWTGTDWVWAPAAANNPQGSFVADPMRGLLTFPQQTGQFGRLALLTSVPAAVTGYGAGCALGSAPGLGAVGKPQPGTADFRFEVQAFAGSAPVLLLAGLNSQNTPLGNGCALLVGQPMVAQFAIASPAGWRPFPMAIPANNALLGLQVFAQAAVLDPPRSMFGGITISGGVHVTVGW